MCRMSYSLRHDKAESFPTSLLKRMVFLEYRYLEVTVKALEGGVLLHSEVRVLFPLLLHRGPSIGCYSSDGISCGEYVPEDGQRCGCWYPYLIIPAFQALPL